MSFKLNSGQLEAFLALSKERSFTRAARHLNITQPALSQRFRLLEEAVGVPLIQKANKGFELTSAGQELLLFCQTQASLENELIARINRHTSQELIGELRIGASSSHMRSVVIPILSRLGRENPELHFLFTNQSISKLSEMLINGALDVILTDTEIHKSFIINEAIAREQFVMLDTAKKSRRYTQFLGTDAQDPTLSDFMKIQSPKLRKKPIEKTHMGDVYSILDGIEQELGSAVVPLHLVPEKLMCRIDKRYQALSKEIYMSYYQQPFYAQAHTKTLEAIRDQAKEFF